MFATLIPITLFFLPETCPACINKSEGDDAAEKDQHKDIGRKHGTDGCENSQVKC